MIVRRCGLFALLALAACSGEPFAPDLAALRVSVDPADVAVEDDGTSVGGTITAVVENASLRRIDFNACGAALERQVAGEWRTVWSVTCILLAFPPNWLEPGDSRALEVPLFAQPGPTQDPEWVRPLDGSYRLRLIVMTDDGRVPFELTTSNEFVIGPGA
jgi:hypothetical protein